MSNVDNIQKSVSKMLVELFDVPADKIHSELEFNDLENWDSLTQVRFIVALENEFNHQFKDSEISKLKTLGGCVHLLTNR
ncbi:MAG: hypothetical protein HKN22_06255 [Bacteroidia bacterium]|nr:hypothetical protein [Bacteroidia bacterium]